MDIDSGPGDDPSNWSVDRVIQELCTPNRSWQPRSALMATPDGSKLEQALRDNLVTGDVLLNEVDDSILRNDFGIKALGHRAFVRNAISELQLMSVRYQSYYWKHRSKSELGNLLPELAYQHNVRQLASSEPLPSSQQQIANYLDNALSLLRSSRPPSFALHGSSEGSMSGAYPTHTRHGNSEYVVSDDSSGKRRKLDTSGFADDGQFENRVGSGDQNFGQDEQDEHGILTPATDTLIEKGHKKTRRIAPTFITSQIDPNRNRDLPTAADDVILNDPGRIESRLTTINNNGRTELIATRQPHLDPTKQSKNNAPLMSSPKKASFNTDANIVPPMPNKTSVKSRPEHANVVTPLGYLGRRKRPVNDIFYEGLAPGENIPESKATMNFFERSQNIPPGQRRYVYSIMKGFLRSEREVIIRDGQSFSAIRPYPERLSRKFDKPSFTLYYSAPDGSVRLRRDHVASWPELNSGTNIPPLSSAANERGATFNPLGPDMLTNLGSYDNWDLSCLEKYKNLDGGDEVLPLYGESDEENEYDLATWKEIEEEQDAKLDRPLKPTRKNRLTPEEISEAIEEGIASLVRKWKIEKLPKQQLRAWSLWTKARKYGTKSAQILAAQRDLDVIFHRIDKLRKEIAIEVWTSKLQIIRQSAILEVNVFARENLCWKISLLKQKHQPVKPAKTAVDAKLKARTVLRDDGEEGESVSSEGEIPTSEDGLDDFIVSDDAGISIEEPEIEVDLAESEDESEDDEDESNSDQSLSSPEPLPAEDTGGTLGNNTIATPGNKNVFRSPSPESGHPILRLKSENTSELPLKNPSPGPINKVIDLTLTSSDEGPSPSKNFYNLTTPEKKKTKLKIVHRNSPFHSIPITISDDDPAILDDPILPPYSDPHAIAAYSYETYERLLDRDRLLIKAISDTPTKIRHLMFQLISTSTADVLWLNMKKILGAYLENESRVKGLDAESTNVLIEYSRLFYIYITGINCGPWRSIIQSQGVIFSIFSGHIRWFPSFFKLCSRLEEYFEGILSSSSSRKKRPSSSLAADETDDEEPLPAVRRRFKGPNDLLSAEEPPNHAASPKKRKRVVYENADARTMREQDQRRHAEQEHRRKELRARLAMSGRADDEKRGLIIINDAKSDDQGYIHVNADIAKRIKKHQIEGVRFLWNRIVTEAEITQGCLLAHTMGLGKTMQVITLLVAIAEAVASPDRSVSSQISPGFRESKTLILCPPTLIDNWMDELLTWAPYGLLGDFRKVDSSLKLVHRLRVISDWNRNGGILILGYEMFRSFIHNKETAKHETPLNEDQHARLCEDLLQGPNIIVADEAHKMKNAAAGVTQAAVRFRSKSRIALTGSPLANNIEEYHTMIEWIAPNYLGPIVEFRAKYVEPIQDGLFRDSTSYERRKSLKMLGVLKEDLSPKVHRADMSVLRNDLPKKTEFVITVPLTELQRRAYSNYVSSVTSGSVSRTSTGEVTQTTLWHWLNILSLLCNHPSCFKAKLDERKEDVESQKEAAAEVETPTTTDLEESIAANSNTPIWKVGVSQALIDDQTRLFNEQAPVIDSISHSNKVRLLCQILDFARDAGDKTLVFSQSIPTLNFLEKLCIQQGRKYARLDGKTKMTTRQGLTKAFNSDRTELYLISTSAGGLGLNLPGANRVVIFDFKFNPIMEEQAVGRAYRIGQKKETFVYRFVAGGTFEDSVHNKTIFKMQLASRVVDKKNPVAYARKRLGDFLFEPKHVEQSDLAEFDGMDQLVLDRILKSQEELGTIRSIVQTDTFERDDEDKLTAEEEQEVKQLLGDEQLKRSDPKKWHEKQVAHARELAMPRYEQNLANSANKASAIRRNHPAMAPFSNQENRRMENNGRFGEPAADSPITNLSGDADKSKSTRIIPGMFHPSLPTQSSPSSNKRGRSPIQGTNTRKSASPVSDAGGRSKICTADTVITVPAMTKIDHPSHNKDATLKALPPTAAEDKMLGVVSRTKSPTSSFPISQTQYPAPNPSANFIIPSQKSNLSTSPQGVTPNKRTNPSPIRQDARFSDSKSIGAISQTQSPCQDKSPKKSKRKLDVALTAVAKDLGKSETEAISLAHTIRSLIESRAGTDERLRDMLVQRATETAQRHRTTCETLLHGHQTPIAFLESIVRFSVASSSSPDVIGEYKQAEIIQAKNTPSLNVQSVKSLKTPVISSSRNRTRHPIQNHIAHKGAQIPKRKPQSKVPH